MNIGVLTVDPARVLAGKPEIERCQTGIYVRAMLDGQVGNYDIIELDRDSLMRWLRSGGRELAENCVALLLGHARP